VSAPGFNSLRARWISRARELERRGHFDKYSSKQKAEVLRKGFLGTWPPDRAIEIALETMKKGFAVRTPKFNDELREHFGLVGPEAREAVLDILAELPPESYEPPVELAQPPGYPFIFECERLKKRVYFKFQVAGGPRKLQVLFWSCHPPLFRRILL
jgi:hypothetical protein